jgi:hypothetical protein
LEQTRDSVLRYGEVVGCELLNLIVMPPSQDMKAPVACPHCDSSFRVPRDKEGKRATCPKCKQPFVITFHDESPAADDFAAFDTSPPPPIPTTPIQTTAPQPVVTSKSASASRRSKKTTALPQWAIIALPAIATLILGYFLGREHLKYQMRSALSDVASAFSEGFKDASGSDSTSSTLDSVETSAEPLPQLPIGQTHKGDGFAITLTNAKIEKPKVKDMMGDVGMAKNPDLVLSFTFANTDDRKILRFRRGNQFMAGHFRLRDDVDNVIRGVNYGMGAKPVGALTGSEDITPGGSATHVELFSVPPPKTEFLILTVNTACIGGQGEIEFKIPSTSIAR